MTAMKNDSKEVVDGSRLLKAVEAISIAPADAHHIADQYLAQVRKKSPGIDDATARALVADKIVARYAKLAGTVGGTTALAGVVPGLGTAIALTGGAAADAAACMKLQVDMVMCMAAAYGYDLNSEDARQLSFIIAAGGALEKAGVQAGTRLASKAGVNLVRQYLKGAVLQALKEMFKTLGIVFTRKALEKALPFGIGVVIGSSANYALTRYVGKQAREWFVIDSQM
ncbi:hypothetical protein FRC96_15095 [Lujinxingia vulgaris]|uniref:EcsC family protein n=1 Tax=Lujinxingia vulgaris TaxID=2600176 RepID=A0A5C6WWI5_9DELT|nr:EcsC family protein [Lujinxingia vulgaris]TXD33796.1 hypothetical protein FRC96_15095 [Lujinxingia vulgaris]